MDVPIADLVGRRGTGRAGGAPKCVPAATEGFAVGQVWTGAGPSKEGGSAGRISRARPACSDTV
eukprot:352895-Chlamydomonas_euryale.AAC.7